MWIILLDHSGSMGEPFSGSPDRDSRRIREVDTEIKLNAAKEVLLEEISLLGKDVQVVIFGFTSQARELFSGTAGQREDIQNSIAPLQATNGTSIAASLDAAADYKIQNECKSIPQVVLISDGQSDRSSAKKSARKCAELSMGIHFIPIDPTEQSKAFILEVVGAVGGTVSPPVTSRSQLKDAAAKAREDYTTVLQKAEEYLELPEQQAKEIEEETKDQEHIEFTAGYPGSISKSDSYPLFVYMHLSSMRDEVRQKLEKINKLLGRLPRKSEAEANLNIPIGSQIEITPRIPNILVNPPQQRLHWLGELEEITFRIRYSGKSPSHMPCSGFIDVSTQGLLISQIPVSISIESKRGKLTFQHSNAEMISRIFASYAREDTAIVEACRTAYRALGILLFVDKHDLLSGQDWNNVIRQNIAKSNIFQLYWSKRAADSNNVANEWKLALLIAENRKYEFIRPLYWTKPKVEPQPPQALSHLDFSFLNIDSLNIEGDRPARTEPQQIESGRISVRFPIVQVVDYKTEQVEQLQQELSQVVPYLEHVVGVRYYPPMSFLVDEHVVKTVKAEMVPIVSERADDEQEGGQIEYILDLLQSLALGFHVGKLVGSKSRHEDRTTFFNVCDKNTKVEYNHIVFMSEYLFFGPVRNYFNGKNDFENGRETLEEVLLSIVSGKVSSTWDAGEMIEWLLDVASLEDRAQLQRIISGNDIKELKSFGDKGVSVASRLPLSKIGRYAAKYHIEKLFGRPAPTKLRFKKDFVEYVRAFCDSWLSYIDVALEKRGDAIIDVGYSSSEVSIQWLKRNIPEIRIIKKRTEEEWRTKGKIVYYDIYLSDYRVCVERLSRMLSYEMSNRSSWVSQRFIPALMSTYGAFLPASARSSQVRFEKLLDDQGWPKQFTQYNQDKILVCLGALERLRTELSDMAYESNDADTLLHRLSLSVLVHEHFHSALVNGVDRNGQASFGKQRPTDLEHATALNEALAVWTELHFFRDDPEMLQHIDAYIRSGHYPRWPYQGAELIETFFREGGLPAVRGWIQYLRDDPINAQMDFDEKMSSNSQPKG